VPFTDDVIRVTYLKHHRAACDGRYVHYVTRAATTICISSQDIFHILGIFQRIARVNYVCVNRHRSEAWHHRLYNISCSISKSSNYLLKQPTTNSNTLSVQINFLLKIYFQIHILYYIVDLHIKIIVILSYISIVRMKPQFICGPLGNSDILVLSKK